MTHISPRSTFFGPQRAISVGYPANVIHLTLYDLQPGQFWNPALEAELLTPQILPPFLPAAEALFRLRTLSFNWVFRIGPLRNFIRVQLLTDFTKFAFFRNIPFALDTFAYSELTAAAGNFAFNGSATIAWGTL